MNRVLKIISICLGVSIVTGCQDRSMIDLKNFVEKERSGSQSSIDPLPAPKPHPTYAYSASDQSDPFDVTNIAPQQTLEFKDPRNSNRRKEELEAFSLDGIKIVGTLAVNGTPWAVVNAPDGTVHKVKRGRYMGENDGKVVAIDLDEQKLTLVEDVQSATGEWVQREIFLSVSDE